MTDLEDHPIANIFPLLPEPELRELAEDIRANGLQIPIVLFENKILDGRNRYRAAKLVGAHVVTNYYTGDAPTDHVMSLNLHRRQLTASQRAAVAAQAMPFYEAEARQRQAHGKTAPDSTLPAKLPEASDKGGSRDKAAKLTEANRQYVQDPPP